ARAVLEEFGPKEVASRLRDVAAQVDREPPAAVAGRIRQAAKALTDAIAEAGTLYAPAALHEVRIAAKKLRYNIELSPAGEHAPGTLRRLRGIQRSEERRVGKEC